MDKKGALELSINAIVILIIAITMLGLGLGFVRGMFGKASGQFEELTGAEPEPPAPSSSNPVTLSREVVIANSDEKVAIKVGFYNTGAAEDKVPTITPPGCTADASANTVNVGSQKTNVFTVLFTTVPASGTTLCTVSVDGKTKEFALKIKS